MCFLLARRNEMKERSRKIVLDEKSRNFFSLLLAWKVDDHEFAIEGSALETERSLP